MMRRYFNIPTCDKLLDRLRTDPDLTKAQQLKLVHEHRVGVRRLCREYIRMRRSLRTEREMIALMATARMALDQMRRGMLRSILEYVEQAKTMVGWEDVEILLEDADDDPRLPRSQRACEESVWDNDGCRDLLAHEQQLIRDIEAERAGLPMSFGKFITLTRQAGRYLLRGVVDSGTRVLAVLTTAMSVVIPSIVNLLVKAVVYVCGNPATTLAMLLYARTLRDRLCETLTAYYARRPVARGGGPDANVAVQKRQVERQRLTLPSLTAAMADLTWTHVRETGSRELFKELGAAVGDLLRSYARPCGTAVGALVASMVALPTAAAQTVNDTIMGIIENGFDVAAKSITDAAATALASDGTRNALTLLFDTLRFGDCHAVIRRVTRETLEFEMDYHRGVLAFAGVPEATLQDVGKAVASATRQLEILDELINQPVDEDTDQLQRAQWVTERDDVSAQLFRLGAVGRTT